MSPPCQVTVLGCSTAFLPGPVHGGATLSHPGWVPKLLQPPCPSALLPDTLARMLWMWLLPTGALVRAMPGG